jgi:hypothetical protein
VESENPKGSSKIAIDFACPLQADCHARPKTCHKLQEHLCLHHNMLKGHPFCPTADAIKNGSYKELLNSNDLLFPNEIEDEDIVPVKPPKTITYIRTKRGGIDLTIEEMENHKSDSNEYVPEDVSYSDTSGDVSKGRKEKGYTKKMAKRAFSWAEDKYEPEAHGRIRLPKKLKQSRKCSKPAASRYEESSKESNGNKASSSDEDSKKIKARKVQKMPAQRNPTKAAKHERDADNLEEAKKDSAPDKPTCPKCSKSLKIPPTSSGT